MHKEIIVADVKGTCPRFTGQKILENFHYESQR